MTGSHSSLSWSPKLSTNVLRSVLGWEYPQGSKRWYSWINKSYLSGCPPARSVSYTSGRRQWKQHSNVLLFSGVGSSCEFGLYVALVIQATMLSPPPSLMQHHLKGMHPLYPHDMFQSSAFLPTVADLPYQLQWIQEGWYHSPFPWAAW